MDMVCQAANGVDHDFKRDPIRPQILADDPDWMLARGTTLGADNGIGMAAILAVLEATDLVHGPLEALFTVNEENGMSGARGLKPDSLKGNYVLNLDSEAIDELTIGCAGSLRANARLELPAMPEVSLTTRCPEADAPFCVVRDKKGMKAHDIAGNVGIIAPSLCG